MMLSCNEYVAAFIGLMCGSKRRDSMNQRVIATIGALLIGTSIISGCGSDKPPEDTTLKVRTITIGEESGTTSAGYAGTIHNRTETKLAFQIWRPRYQQILSMLVM